MTTIDKGFLYTKQLRVLKKKEDMSEVDKIIADKDPGTLAETIIDLHDVTGVAESVEDDGEVNPDETVLMYFSDEVVVESPFKKVAIAWVQARRS